MEKTLLHFMDSLETGLVLIDYPTGIGKTHDAIEYMVNHYNDDKVFIYITPLKKNVRDAYDSIVEGFNSQGLDDWAKNNVMLLESNFDNIRKNINVDTNFDSWSEIEYFQNMQKLFKLYENAPSEDIKNLIVQNEMKFRKDIEFRLKAFKTSKERKDEIIKNHIWLTKLYPGIFADDKKILVMTFDKFLSGNSTLIKSTYRFIDSKIIKNSLVFIDEIDSTAEKVLNHFIDDILKNNNDLIDIFKTARDNLNNNFPDSIFEPSCLSTADKEFYKGIIANSRKIFNDIWDKYNLQYLFKYKGKKNINSIFSDITYLTISSNNKRLYLNTDLKDGYNYIEEKDKNNNLITFNFVLSEIKGAVNYLMKGISFLSLNYYQKVNENGDFELQEAVEQFLDVLGLKKYNMSIRILNLINNYSIGNNTHSENIIETDIYSKGFRFCEFSDHAVSSIKTNIRNYELNDTPEHFLITLCSKCYVVGLSATATMNTVLGNYNLDYIKGKLGEKFYLINNEDNKRIDLHIKNQLSLNRSITSVLEIDSNSNLFLDKEMNEYYDAELNKYLILNNNIYLKEKFLNIVNAVSKFIDDIEGNCLLILSNRGFKNENSLFSKQNLETFINLKKSENILITDNILIYIMDSKNFEEIKEQYIKDLKNGKKVIILSSYQTVGIGQNLQYEKNKKSYDIDSLYLERPTNLIVNVNDLKGDNITGLMQYLYQIESLKMNGELSNEESVKSILEGFYKRYGIDKRLKINHYNTESFNARAMTILIQAVGRICRCHDVAQKKTIYVDKSIFTDLDFNVLGDKILNKEFDAIKQKNVELNRFVTTDRENKIIIKYENINNILAHELKYVSKSRWNENKIENWKQLRDFVLKHPTITKEELGNYPMYSNLYCEFGQGVNKYYYKSIDDFSDVKIKLNFENGFSEFSESDCCLNILMKNKKIKEYFNSMGYATTFDKKELVLLPVIYNNIYKGALGETVGKYLLNEFEIELQEINILDDYEKFDYKYKNNYFDFKLWKKSDYDVDHKWINKKLNMVNGNKAFIVNVLGDKTMNITYDNNICVIPCIIDDKTGEILFDKINKLLKGVK